jgi:signal transduction histidine kinase
MSEFTGRGDDALEDSALESAAPAQLLRKAFELAGRGDTGYREACEVLLSHLHTTLRAVESQMYGLESGAEYCAQIAEGESTIRRREGARAAELAKAEFIARRSGDCSSVSRERNTDSGAGGMLTIRAPVRRHGLAAFQYVLAVPIEHAKCLGPSVMATLLTLPQLLDDHFALSMQQADWLRITAHQLRTPVHSIQSFLTVLFGGYLATPEDIQRYKDTVLSLVRQFSHELDWPILSENARRGELTIRPAQCDLAEVVRESVELTKRVWNRQIQLSADETMVGDCDAQRMLDVLLVLLSNACKYSPEGSPVAVAAAAHRRRATITIRDHGIGIPEDELARIFDFGFVGRRARALNYDGSGIGLFLARRIVEAHRGGICVASDTSGTVFTVWLPLDLRAGPR